MCTIIYYFCNIHRKRARGGGGGSNAARPLPLLTPLPLWLRLCLRGAVCANLFIFGCGNISILSARSDSSRVALRPERAVLNQPEFQGWFEREWELCFCRLICAQETILTAPYIVFRLCGIVVTARSDSSRAALRPERAVLNQPEFQGWIEREWEICVLSIDLCSGDDSHCAICRFSLVRS